MNIDEQIEKLHKATCDRQANGYIDPRNGFFVLSAYYLEERGHCCGSGCRHCPYSPEEQRKAGRTEIKEEKNRNG